MSVQWAVIPRGLLERAVGLVAGAPADRAAAFADGWRQGFEAGYDRGYGQAEADEAQAQAQADAAFRRTAGSPSHCVLMLRRNIHPQAPCRDEWCPLQTAEQRVAAADAFQAALARRHERKFAEHGSQLELPR